MLDGTPENTVPTREFLEIIRKNSYRMSRLTEDLLTLARVESGETRFDSEPVPPVELLHDAEAVSYTHLDVYKRQGRLQPHSFLGGDFTLDLDRTRRVTAEWLKKERLKRQRSPLTLERFAAGVVRVVNATMEKAIRVVSIERGRDSRDFALVAFGGAGGLHGCALAEALSIPHVIVPALPGALSAFGILVSDVVKDYSRTVLWRAAGKLPHARLAHEFAALKKQSAEDYREEAWQGPARYHASVDIRYRGQGYELNLPFTRNLPVSYTHLDVYKRQASLRAPYVKGFPLRNLPHPAMHPLS